MAGFLAAFFFACFCHDGMDLCFVNDETCKLKNIFVNTIISGKGIFYI